MTTILLSRFIKKIEVTTPVVDGVYLTETGDYFITEDGNYLATE